MLFEILKFNYPLYNNINILLKIFSTLTIFPLILIVFKNRTLAFLTTIVHAISYPSTGALTYILQGVFYLGIIFMNVFFILYFWAVTKISVPWTLVASLSLALSYILAAGRIYPIFILILIIEAFLLFRYGLKNLFISLTRIVLFLAPTFVLVMFGSRNIPYAGAILPLLKDLMSGDLSNLLFPLSGLGYLFLPTTFLGGRQMTHTLLGIILITSSCFFFWKMWIDKEKMSLRLTAIIAIFFSFLFITGTWLFVGKALFLFDAYGGINRYFTFPALGASLFIGTILTALLKNTSHRSNFVRSISQCLVFLTLIFIFQTSSKEIDLGFRQINSTNPFLLRNAYLHQRYQEKFMSNIPIEELKNDKPALLYFELPDDKREYYERAIDLHDMQRWLYLRLGFKGTKCLQIVDSENMLKELIRIDNSINKLNFDKSWCIFVFNNSNLSSSTEQVTSYDIQSLHAFRVEKDQFINITEEIVNKFQLQ